MCLGTLDKQVFSGKTRKGYKVVLCDKSGHICPCYHGSQFKVGVWMEDPNTKPILLKDGKFYPTGFHIFLTQKDIKNYCLIVRGTVREVEFDDVVASGKEGRVRVVVARKLFIKPLRPKRAAPKKEKE